MHIELGSGAKWKLIYQFTQSGAFAEHYVHRYTQVINEQPGSTRVLLL